MTSLSIAAGAALACPIAYHTYGKFLARRIFELDDRTETPACRLRDDVDYVPTKSEVLFGHHFTSIAGAGPIVGPALAIIWGWVPALWHLILIGGAIMVLEVWMVVEAVIVFLSLRAPAASRAKA